MKTVGQPIRKKDAMALVTGQPVFTDDIAPKNCLIVKVLRSPHANAMVRSVKKDLAEKVEGIEAVYTWEDVPDERFTLAGQTYPEASPYDRLILDRHVRYVGDPVAIVAGRDEACVDQALKRLKVEYEILPAILDLHEAKDSEILVHPEENWKALCKVGADNKRNLCASGESHDGDVKAVLQDCEEVVEGTYHVKANQQAMMETFRTVLLSGSVRAVKCNEFHSDRFSCEKDPFQCPWHFQIQDPGIQAQDRRRIRGKTDVCIRDLSGVCDLEDRQAF